MGAWSIESLGEDDDGLMIERIDLDAGWALVSLPLSNGLAPGIATVKPIASREVAAYGEDISPIAELGWIDLESDPTYH